MRISAKVEYACLAILELAARYNTNEPVRIRTIAQEHGIPERFLVQILLQLKGSGLVASTRGAAGGYQLIKSPEDISLGEVMWAIEGQEEPSSALSDRSATGKVLHEAWREISAQQHTLLEGLTFANLAERVKAQAEVMYYI
jgi:Rrf2 family protein